MANTDRLIRVSTFFNGSYLNGEGREVTYTHEVLEKQRPSRVLASLRNVENGMEARRLVQRGAAAVLHAGLSLLAEEDMTLEGVAEIAMSQLDPRWIERYGSRPFGHRRIEVMAGVLTVSRTIAYNVHEAELNLDQAR